MVRLRSPLLIGIVWLTAGMSFVAGLPHFDCVCPNGNHKPFCFGFGFGADGCCGRACCSSTPTTEPIASQPTTEPVNEACCCCCHTTRAPSHASFPTLEARSAGCHKTLVQATLVVEPVSSISLDSDLARSLSLPSVTDQSLSLSAGTGDWSVSWEPQRLPPPTDLVIALRHFVI